MSRTEPVTDAGRRLLRMFTTERMPSGRRVPSAFDARLAERIVEELVPQIEAEARASEPPRPPEFLAASDVGKS